MPVTLTPQGLQIDGAFVPVYSGTVHYWRLERAEWETILAQVQSLGFHMIETYIPWSVHETAPGVFDWGETDPRKNLKAFMDLCEAHNLWLLVRPGPLINAELTDFGFPEWVLMDPAVQSRTALDTIHFDAAWGLHPPHQFPVPSYASEKFYTYVVGWFDALCPRLVTHLAPRGCIVGVQSDNETCYLFHDQTYATDYSADSLKLYRSFLRDQYTTLPALNAAYHSRLESFDAVEPPRDCDIETRTDVPRHVDWAKYKEYQIRYAVGRIARIMKTRGIQDVPIFHDVAYQYEPPLDMVALQAEPDVDWVGMNLYCNQDDYAGAVKRIRYLAGTTPLPFVPEFGAGLWSHHSQLFTPQEHEFITLSALMQGLKAFNFYMLVERDRWTGSPITRHGVRRPEYAPFYSALMSFLHTYRFWEFEKQRDTLVLLNFDAERYNQLTSTLHYAHTDLLGLPPELFDVTPNLDFRWDPKLEATEKAGSWLGTLTHWLNDCHIPYDFGDTHLNAAQLQRYTRVAVPMVDFLDPLAQAQLLAYAHAGGHLLLGPGMPYLTPALAEFRLLANMLDAPGNVSYGKGCVTWTPTAQLAAELAKAIPAPEISSSVPSIDLALHCAPASGSGPRELLFAANPSATAQATNLLFDGTRHFTPAWATSPPLAGQSPVALTLPPYSVNIWEVVRD